jgi:hypothetical protein
MMAFPCYCEPKRVVSSATRTSGTIDSRQRARLAPVASQRPWRAGGFNDQLWDCLMTPDRRRARMTERRVIINPALN